ncbi:MAG: peroxide stress protein YaaA [Rhodoluna sp.]
MIFLLPPSESKAKGGGMINITQAALTFGALNPARDEVLSAQGDDSLLSAPTMPAIDRYTGTLYSAIHGRGLKGSGTENNSLDSQQRKIAKSMVLIQSALFGLISPNDLIPEYKLKPDKMLNGLNLKSHWNLAHSKIWPRIKNGPIIDLRSKAYADLAAIPESIESYRVTVFLQRADGSREQMNHFNKKAKGQLVRAAITANKTPNSIADLKKCAKKSGLVLEVYGQELTLIVFEI